MQNNSVTETSYLVSIPAIIIWLVLCVVAVFFGNIPLAIFLGFISVISLFSYFWAKYSLKNVNYKIKIRKKFIFPGQTFTIRRIIENNKTLPLLWLEILEECDIDDCALTQKKYIIKNLYREEDVEKFRYERLYNFSIIKWNERIEFKDKWEAKHRGILQIDSSEISSGDGFGLCKKKQVFTFDKKRITVFPKLVNVSIDKILNDMWDSRSAAKGYLQDRTIIKSTREYLPGDPVKDINLRLLAKGLGLKTNVFEIVTPDSVLFILDSASFRDYSSEKFEESLSVLASIINKLCNRGINVSLLTPKSKWFEEGITGGGKSESSVYSMLERLSAASSRDYSFEKCVDPIAFESMQVYYAASDIKSATSMEVLADCPEHKVKMLLLNTDEAKSGESRIKLMSFDSLKRTS